MVGVEHDDLGVAEAHLAAGRQGVGVVVADEGGVRGAEQRAAEHRVGRDVGDDLFLGVVEGEQIAGERAGTDLDGDGVVGAEVGAGREDQHGPRVGAQEQGPAAVAGA